MRLFSIPRLPERERERERERARGVSGPRCGAVGNLFAELARQIYRVPQVYAIIELRHIS